MVKENNESKPKDKLMLNLDGKEYVIDDLTDYQKSIVADIDQYRIQITRLQRWEAGQIMVLRESLEKEEKKPEPEASEVEA
tara:strand:- start:1156 stop:1398 length:243 start_codon:yes stop_codon:yes gene_type:complete